MRFEDFAFGRIRVDGAVYDHDLVIDHGKIHKRKKQPSKKYRESFGHTPLSAEEKIPWNCGQLVIGTGMWCSACNERSEARGPEAWGCIADSADREACCCSLGKNL